jgi:flagellar motor switch protein FliN
MRRLEPAGMREAEQSIMNQQDRGVEAFLEAWAPEFARSVEMFRGEQPGVSGTRVEQSPSATEEVFWWQQHIEAGGNFVVWVGTPAETWSELAAGLAETPDECKHLYLEMLGPSLQGVAHALSAGRSPRIVCKEGSEQNTAPPAGLQLGALRVTMQEKQLASVVVGLEPSFASLLGTPEAEEPAPVEAPASANTAGYESRLLFERLIELELPIAIVLGRAALPIRDVLKLSAGSLVDLDRRVGDPVEIVVHNVVVARGEVVAVKGNYGVRVKEVISRKERIALQASVRKGTSLATVQ